MYNIKAKNNFFRRPDLSSDLRLQIAYKVLILHYWGIVTEMSKQYDVSRKFIYTLVNQLKQAQSFYYDVKQKSSQKIAKILFYKYMLSLRLEGKCPIQGISQVMKRFNLSYSSVGSISQSLYYFGSVVGNTLFSNDDTIRLIVFASDEIFSHSQPILITVDPVSSAILKVELSDSRKADVWVKHWQALKANNFEPLYLVSDSGISLCIAQELELSNTYRQPDTFHAVSHILGAWVTRLEAAAYKAINEEYWCEKILAIAKSDEVITKRKVKYKKSQEKSQEAITLYDSVHVHSNMARLGRIRILSRTLIRLLLRVFGEHCDVGTGLVQVKPSKEVSSDSVQNPSDPDAGYDGHKGQGFQTQLLETYSTEDDRENQKENNAVPLLNLITYVETESADKHDSHALEPALKDMKERGHEVEKVLADTSYGSNKNIKNAKNNGVAVIAPISGKPSQNRFETFELDPVTLEIKSCLAYKNPDEVKHNKTGSTTVIWSESTCENCPFADICPTQECKKGRKFYYTEDSAISFLRRQYEESIDFKDEYRYRSGIEATNSRFIHMTGARRSKYRGLEKMKFGQKLKALAINVFRIAKYLQKVHKNVYVLNFKSDFFTMNEFTTKFAA